MARKKYNKTDKLERSRDVSHWYFRGQKLRGLDDLPGDIDDYYGFVYLIYNVLDNRFYVGKKNIRIRRKKYYKSKYSKKRVSKRVISESDWKTYTGSCEELNEDIEKIGKDNFKFYILAWAETKGQLNYLEENVQHKLNVLSDIRFYNNTIGAGKYRGVKITGTFRENIGLMDSFLSKIWDYVKVEDTRND